MTQEEFDTIERYLDGDPAASFDELTRHKTPDQVTALRQQIEAQRDLRLAVGTSNLRTELAHLHATRQAAAPGKPVRRRVHRVVYVMVVLLLVLGILAYLFWPDSEGAAQGPIAAYEYLDPGLPSVMGLTDDPAFAAAMTRFKRGDYPAARTAFASLGSGYNDTLTYYRGASAYYAKDYAAATRVLDSVAADDTSLFRPRAEYLLALAHWKGGRAGAARSLLTRISKQKDHPFAEQARQILTSGSL